MLRTLQQRKTGVRIFLGAVLLFISGAMVITLVPGPVGTLGSSPDAVASVGGQEITAAEVRQQLDRVTRGQSVPKILQGLYAKQVMDQIVFERALEFEAKRLGIRVTPEEQAERIKQLLPSVFAGDTWVGKDRYAAEVEQRAGMSVEDFETYIRQSLLQEKFHRLVTDGIAVTPAEVEQEFRRRNEKVKIEFALVKPADLAATINPSDAELAAYFAKNQSRYPVPERRSVRYALLDFPQVRQRAPLSEDEIRGYYNQHLDRYKVQNRAHVEHILFKTVGKTDAEVAEIRKNAEDVLKKAKHGGNFEDLAKKNSEDTTKDKGGDLGWIVQGQTVPEFEHAAFTLPKGDISDLVKTQYGFHIIKVLDRENAHTRSLDEVRAEIRSTLLDEKADALGNELATQMAAAVRQSNRQPLDDLARKFGMTIAETRPVGLKDPVGDLGNSPDVHDAVFRLHPGELSAPLRLERGYAIVTVKAIEPAHQGALAEVRDAVLADYRREKSAELAHTRADELAKRVAGGEALVQAAKSLGLGSKTSEPFSRTGTVPDVGSANQLEAAFTMAVGQSSGATFVDSNWLVYKVVDRQDVNPEDLDKQRAQIERELLQSRQSMAFEAFHNALEDRMKQEGKLTLNPESLKRLTTPS